MTQHRLEMIDDAEEALLVAFHAWQTTVWTALPGIVQSVDFAKNTVAVQPSIQAQVRDPKGVASWVSLPMLVDCPLIFPGGGGFCLTFPIKAGDEVLVLFSNRCIDAWWQLGGVQTQAELRMHDLSDGFALPSPRSLPRAIPSVSSENVELRNDVNTAKVLIKPNGNLELYSTTKIRAYTDGDAEIVAGGNVTVTAPNIALVGNVDISGGTLKHNGVNIGSTHVHGNVRSGTDNSGVPH